MRARDANDIEIARYLEREGLSPARVRNGGRELWYSSPIRSGDKTPSFKVDVSKNLWYDHGLGQGGTLVDLVCELKSVTVADALALLDQSGLGPVTQQHTDAPRLFTPLQGATSGTRGFAGEKEKELQERCGSRPSQILSVGDVRHPALLDYIDTRGLDRVIACQHLREIYFAPANGVGRFFALGFPCGDGFDASSSVFKGFVGSGKDISLIAGTSKTHGQGREIAVFEGFMDYLSLLTHRGTSTLGQDVLILHSIALKRRAATLMKAGNYSCVSLYLDHDDAGRQATKFLIAEMGGDIGVDASALYDGHKDLNEWLVDGRQH